MSDTPAPVTPALAAPVADRERIVSLDVLRGVAVLGILALNIQLFAMIGAAYTNPTAYGDLEGANYYVWWLTHVLGDQKFMTIFSMLFGAGVVLMTTRAEAKTQHSAAVHYRRMGWLLLIGMLHAYLLWYGDILFYYAVCGMVAWLLRKLPPALLIPLGLIAIGIGSAFSLGFGALMLNMPEDALRQMTDENWMPPPEVVDHELGIYRGGWLEQMPHRLKTALFFQVFVGILFIGPKAGGLMLIGMALYKLGIFSAARSLGFYVVMFLVCAGIGYPIVVYGLVQHEAHDWDILYSMQFGSQYNYWASLLVSLGYVALVMIACKTLPAVLLRPFAATGRMALTNYLMQTIICTTIFYGHGFGQFGHVERTGQIMIVVSIWAFQLITSPIWLTWFRFGPFEWLWRSLTYWRPQAFRR